VATALSRLAPCDLNRHWQLESARAGAPRIDVADAVPSLDPRLVRVPEHNGSAPFGDGFSVELCDPMQYPDLPLSSLNDLLLGHGRRPCLSVVVAAHGERGRNGAQLIEHVRRADIANVNDEFRTLQCHNSEPDVIASAQKIWYLKEARMRAVTMHRTADVIGDMRTVRDRSGPRNPPNVTG
jgi:hypothetical protein